MHLLGGPEAEAVDDEAEDDGEDVEEAVAAQELDAWTRAAEGVENERDARGEDGEEHEGYGRPHYQHDLTICTVF